MKEISYNSDQESAFETIRICISDKEILKAIEEYYRKTGDSKEDLAYDAIVSYLEDQNLLVEE